MTKMAISFFDISQHIQENHANKHIEIVTKFPMLDDVQENVMLGSFSWYYTKTRRKDILRPFAYQFPDFISTPSELARSYLELKYPKQRATKRQIDDFRRLRVAPLYAQPISYEEGAYIDIRSAYWQILQVVGWDADYSPGEWLAKKESMEDFPFPDFKLSRNCLVTAGLPSEASYWSAKEHRFSSTKTFNKTLNLGIWALTLDVLHAIAWDAIAAGACYVHTDGYICHRSRIQAVQSAIARWGLETRIKAYGRTSVFGVGSYEVGDKSTKNPHHVTEPYLNVELTRYNVWLRTRFQRLAERTKFIWSSEWQSVIKSQSLKQSEQ